MEFEAYAFSQHNIGNLLYSFSMMDYLSKALKDGIGDSPPSRGAILVVVNLSFCFQDKATIESSKSKC